MTMWRPALAMARSRLGGLIAVACAVAGGAAMATATGVVVETGIASHAPAQRLAAAEVLVSGEQYVAQDEDVDVNLPDRVPVDAGLVDRLAKLPGVDAAVGDVSFPAAVVSVGSPAGGADAGHGWGSATLGGELSSGRAPSGRHEVALDSGTARGARAGQEIALSVDGAVARYRVSGIVDAPGTGIYFDDATARRLAQRDSGAAKATVDLIAVRTHHPSTVAKRISAALAGSHVVVTTGADRGDVESLAAGAGRGTLVAIAASLGGTVVLIVGFIVAAALSVSVAGQRRELALLRAIGATPRQVRRLIAAQASAVAAGALPIGIAAGYLLAQRFAALLASSGEVPSDLPVHLGPLPAVAAAALLLGVVQVAARLAALRTSRASATEAVAESRVEPREPAPIRTTIGFALMGLALGTTVVPLVSRSEAAFISVASGILPAMVGLALAAPSIVRGVTGRLKRRMRPSASASRWLAVANSHGYALRMAGAITVLALAVGFAITQLFSQSALRTAADRDLAEGVRADVGVSAPALGGPTDRDVGDLGALPGVRAAVPMIASSAVWPYREEGKRRADAVSLLALGSHASSVIDPDVAAGSLSRLRGDAVAVDATTAWTEGLSVGDRLELVLADGTRVKPTIVATYDRGFGFGKLIASTDLITRHTATRQYDAVLTAGGGRAVKHWAATHAGHRADAGAGALGAGAVTSDQWVNQVVSLALLGYVLLGVGNGLVAATVRRRGEFAVLRLIGATDTQVRDMMRREALITTAIAIGAGLALSVVPQSLLGLGLVGLPWPQGPLWVIPAIAALVGVLAYLATLLPTRRALREPATAAVGAD